MIAVVMTPAVSDQGRTSTPSRLKPGPTSKPPSYARRSGRPGLPDPLSDKATQLLIRRVLCAQDFGDKGRGTPAPIEQLLPPLTSRNDVDVELYAIIAIVLREFVQAWYNKLTPDETFVGEIVLIIAHCTRALEQRLRKVDLESLLFDELPELLDRHVQAHRTAHDPVARPPIEADPRSIYHAMFPLPSLSPVPHADFPKSITEQAENEQAYRQLLVQGVLAVLLPTEDLENECLTALVGQIFSELIIGGVIAKKASEPWLLYEGLIIVSRVVREKMKAKASGGSAASTATIVYADTEPGHDSQAASGNHPSAAQRRRGSTAVGQLFWFAVRLVFAGFSFASMLADAILLSRSVPPRWRNPVAVQKCTVSATGQSTPSLSEKERLLQASPHWSEDRYEEPVKVPVVAFKIWPAISNLIELDLRMPWVCGTLSLLQWLAMAGPGRVAGLNGVLDRLLSHYIHRRLLDPSQLPPLLRTLRSVLFPNNAPAGPSSLVAPENDAALRALKRRCASAIWALVPTKAAGLRLFGARRNSSSPNPSPSHRDGSRHRSRNRRGEPSLGPKAQAEARAAGATAAAERASGAEPAPAKSATGVRVAGANYISARPLSLQADTHQRRQLPVAHDAREPVAAASARRDDHENGDDNIDGVNDDDGDVGPGNSQGGDEGGDAEEHRILAEIEAGVLDVFGDAYCNKHLMYAVLELVLVRLMPELAEKGVVELWGERLS